MTNARGYTLTLDTHVEGDETVSEEQFDADLAEAPKDMKVLRRGETFFRETIIEQETLAERATIAALFADLLYYANTHTLTEDDAKTVEQFNSRVHQCTR